MRETTKVALTTLGMGALALAWRAVRRPPAPPRPSHVSETEESFRRAGTRVVILGAGFGGLATALALDEALADRPDVSILMIDHDNSSLFTPLIWLVADGRAEAVDVAVPIRAFQRGRRFHLLEAEVVGVDLDRKDVELSFGARPYDYLVIALGSVTELPPLPGVAENAHVFRTPADAVWLRDHLVDAVEAAHRSNDPAERQAWLTFVVGGGGDTGVELAGALQSYLSAGLLREYPWLVSGQDGKAFRVVLVGRAPDLVPMAEAADRAETRRILEDLGVEVWTGTAVQEIRPDAVITSRGTIPARTVFWAAGIAAPPLLRQLPIEHAKGGALVVDDHLRLPSHPEVFVVGDAAWAFDACGDAVPPTAQAAEAEGAYVGREIAARIRGEADRGPFRFEPKGHLELLGMGEAIVRIGRWRFTGLPGWLLWHAYYLSRIPSWKRRMALIGSSLLALVFGREVAQVRLERVEAGSPASGGRAANQERARVR